MQIDWEPPEPRSGAIGQWDRFVGPGATNAEEWIQLILGGCIAAACIAVFWVDAPVWATWYHYVLVVLLGLDIGGGIVTNATNSAKRWYHRSGHGAGKHLLFVSTHVLHLAAIALFFASDAISYFAASAIMFAVSAMVIVSSPLYLQRPIAYGLFALILVASMMPVFEIEGLAWFLPLMALKLLLGHLTKEAPFRPEIEL